VNPAQAKADALARFGAEGAEHANCAQTVLLFGLRLLEEEDELLLVAKYLGGGLSGAGETCGALTGCALALGARDRAWIRLGLTPPEDSPDELRRILRDFTQTFGTCRCRDLTGFDLSTPEGFQEFKKSEASARCPEYVGWVCDRLTPLFERPAASSPPSGNEVTS
jgi:C_GCAxxG_C_C family probable redox protein